MPFYPDPNQDSEGIPYETENFWEHMVAEYLNCSFFQVLDLFLDDFLCFRREAFITEMSKSKEGREYLINARMFESEDADYEGIAELQAMLGGRR